MEALEDMDREVRRILDSATDDAADTVAMRHGISPHDLITAYETGVKP